jgi:chemotaxis protein MotB
MSRFLLPVYLFLILGTGCVSQKKWLAAEEAKVACETELAWCMGEKARLESEISTLGAESDGKDVRINDLKEQLEDFRTQRDAQFEQVEGLTVLSQTANRNIEETLSQLEGKDRYIKLLQAAKNKTDSINLALAVNLKSELKDGIEDEDVEVRVDKTVVMINLSDKMLFESGSSNITSRADEVLEKIATIVSSRPGFDVMVEGYTDSIPINRDCLEDNWDLSAMRAVSVVRSLEMNHGIDGDRLIAAGRGETNPIADNETEEGRSTNRRTRIVIMPQLDQFYDLLKAEE